MASGRGLLRNCTGYSHLLFGCGKREDLLPGIFLVIGNAWGWVLAEHPAEPGRKGVIKRDGRPDPVAEPTLVSLWVLTGLLSCSEESHPALCSAAQVEVWAGGSQGDGVAV